MRGYCLCGSIQFEITGPTETCVYCHCDSCRRQCSAPVTTYVGVKDTSWHWLSGTPRVYHSSPGVERSFCSTCGSPISFRSSKMSGMMHFYAALLDEPENVAPEMHVAYEEKLDWLELSDDLPTCIGPDYTKA